MPFIPPERAKDFWRAVLRHVDQTLMDAGLEAPKIEGQSAILLNAELDRLFLDVDPKRLAAMFAELGVVSSRRGLSNLYADAWAQLNPTDTRRHRPLRTPESGLDRLIERSGATDIETFIDQAAATPRSEAMMPRYTVRVTHESLPDQPDSLRLFVEGTPKGSGFTIRGGVDTDTEALIDRIRQTVQAYHGSSQRLRTALAGLMPPPPPLEIKNAHLLVTLQSSSYDLGTLVTVCPRDPSHGAHPPYGSTLYTKHFDPNRVAGMVQEQMKKNPKGPAAFLAALGAELARQAEHQR